jgi:hypothetical protein
MSRDPHFPIEYLRDFVSYVNARPDIELITYDDLPFEDDYNYEAYYPTEYPRWMANRDPSKIYLLIQYDVDSDPHRTSDILLHHERIKAPVCVMTHCMFPDRRPYLIDWWYLERFSRNALKYENDNKLFCIGYHNNAYCRILKDGGEKYPGELWAYVKSDCDFISCHVGKVRYYSAHGGHRDGNGKTNAHFTPPDGWQEENDLRWVHNHYTVRFPKQYSDGGLPSLDYPCDRNLQNFVKIMQPGYRYRVLLHPQYYGRKPVPVKSIKDEHWYQAVLKRYENGENVWEGME